MWFIQVATANQIKSECGRWIEGFADVAQLVEHSLGKGEVISSILIIGSRFRFFSRLGWKVFAEG